MLSMSYLLILKIKVYLYFQAATRVCFTTCRTTAATGRSFSITGDATNAALNAENGIGTCSADFLMIPNAFDPNNAVTGPRADRFCGTALNTDATQATSITVCSKLYFYLHSTHLN